MYSFSNNIGIYPNTLENSLVYLDILKEKGFTFRNPRMEEYLKSYTNLNIIVNTELLTIGIYEYPTGIKKMVSFIDILIMIEELKTNNNEKIHENKG